MEMLGDVLWQRDTYEEVGQSFAHQDAFFNQLFQTRRIGSAWVDQTGMGEKVVEDLQRLHGTSRVHGELLTGPSRIDLALSLHKRVQEHRIRIRYDPFTRADLMAIKRIGSEQSGGIRIVNADDEVHADRFWAYALASRAADMPPSLYQYQSVAAAVQSARGRDRDDDRPNRHRRGSRFGRGAW
jgi:phage FluMu gp28-like protein